MTRRRPGMVLVATIAVVSLVAILGVATLSLSARLRQESTLSLRDARLNAAASFGLGSVIGEWRARSLGAMAIGATSIFDVEVPGASVGVTAAVTRLDAELFWALAEARAGDGSVRRENLVLRVRLPTSEALLADSSDVRRLGSLDIDSIAATAATTVAAGATWSVGDGVTHAKGDLTIVGGAGRGILVVEGRLVVAGAFTYSGVIVARGGIETSGQAVTMAGLVRTATSPNSADSFGYTRSVEAAKVVLSQALIPRPVVGRPSVEMY